jgi:hypothetical protein
VDWALDRVDVEEEAQQKAKLQGFFAALKMTTKQIKASTSKTTTTEEDPSPSTSLRGKDAHAEG